MKCSNCNQTKQPTNTSDDFFSRIAFKFLGEYFPFSASDLCASCRHQRRLSFRNEQCLYHRNSSVTGERILSLYHPTPLWGAPYEVMLESEWRSDALDPCAYGREIDFNRPFFEQYAELHKSVPRMSIVNLINENSPYTSHTGYSKNCYLLPCSEHCEDCYYGRFLQKCKNCVDCTNAHRSELCYECFEISDCYSCAFLSLSENSHNCYYSENLIGCNHCLFCTNMRRGEYCIYNTKVSPEEFKIRVNEIFASGDSMAEAYREWKMIREKRVYRPANIRNCEHSTGDFLRDSKNVVNCTDVTGCEDCEDIIIGYDIKDSRSCSNIYITSELNYEVLGSTEVYHCAFCFYAFRSQDILYSEYIYDSKKLFGCVGMTRMEHCILNKQYTPSEYEKISAKLVRHMQNTNEWGKQLPSRFSPFGYNETVASDLFPLSKETAQAQGFLWRDSEDKERTRATKSMPPSLKSDVSRENLKDIFLCEVTGQPFRFIGPEIDFYLKEGYPLPRISPRARHQRREKLRFPSMFRTGRCSQCNTAVTTNVPEKLNSQLYCEKCFQNIY